MFVFLIDEEVAVVVELQRLEVAVVQTSLLEVYRGEHSPCNLGEVVFRPVAEKKQVQMPRSMVYNILYRHPEAVVVLTMLYCAFMVDSSETEEGCRTDKIKSDPLCILGAGGTRLEGA